MCGGDFGVPYDAVATRETTHVNKVPSGSDKLLSVCCKGTASCKVTLLPLLRIRRIAVEKKGGNLSYADQDQT